MNEQIVLTGNCLEVLKDFPDNSIDSIVTDPPYGLSFMGKKWDYNVPSVAIWKEVLRVLKPGGYTLSFGGTRTYHRMVVNMEDAGFEIRDQIQWIYGSGFPKSMNVGKKVEGYEGWGTALKPANEPIVLARKPLSESTVAKNVLKWGVGGLNIDGCRIGPNPGYKYARTGGSKIHGGGMDTERSSESTQGRWPANVIFDEAAAKMLDEQSGILKGLGQHKQKASSIYGGKFEKSKSENLDRSEQGGASRFFYVAKVSKRERNAGLEGMPLLESKHAYGDGLNSATKLDPKLHTEESVAARKGNQNNHPTVKPIRLMEYLCKLITPPGGTILDPFTGSGSTGIAAKNLGFTFIGIEMNPEYVEIATRRIEHD